MKRTVRLRGTFSLSSWQFRETRGSSCEGAPGSAGLGHPDKCFVTDIDPDRPGMEIFYAIEPWRDDGKGVCLVEARSGRIIWEIGHKTWHVGNGMVADIDPSLPGLECFATEDPKGGSRDKYMFTAQGERLDSIADFVRKDSLSFERAARLFSTHDDSRTNGGKYVDPQNRSELVAIDQLPPDTYKVVRDLKVGEISDAFQTTDATDRSTIFRIVKLDKQSAPHKANMKDDFNYLQELALNNKRAEVYQSWIKDKNYKLHSILGFRLMGHHFLPGIAFWEYP